MTPKIIPLFVLGGLIMTLAASSHAETASETKTPAALDFKMQLLDGTEFDLADHRGKVVVIVNVASKCGLTPQYEQLQSLHEKYAEKGLVVLGFPCNQFLRQEPGTADEIREFCRVNYGVTFPLFAKIEVNGDDAADLYKHLTSLATRPVKAGPIGWNFAKFIIGRDGAVKARFSPRTKPDDPKVLKVIEAELADE